MNGLQERLCLGPIPFDDFVTAARRTVAVRGQDAVLDDETQDVMGCELYAMALEEPEWDVFS